MRRNRGRNVPMLAAFIVLAGAAWAQEPQGHLTYMDGYLVMQLKGSPEQLGRQHGSLARWHVRRMLKDLIYEGVGSWGDSLKRLRDGAVAMDRHQPEPFRRELRALAEAADVDYLDLMLAQLFGDVQRGQWCTTFAAHGPATGTGECIVGRNMDFYDYDVGDYGACLIHYEPDEGIPFMTITWTGIINGWTLMNAKGIVTANNTAYGEEDSLEGISTCFMLRKVAQYASTVEEGIEIVRRGPRACGTAMLIAGGDPPKAAIVEFDHEQMAVRWAEDGMVCAANSFRKLYRVAEPDTDTDPGYPSTYTWLSRDETLAKILRENYGTLDEWTNPAAAPGVPMRSMNLQCVLLFPNQLRFRAAIGQEPAADQRFRPFKMTAHGLVIDDTEGADRARLYELDNQPEPEPPTYASPTYPPEWEPGE